MNRFLAIPTFRSMKYLHGILFTGTMWGLISWLLPMFALLPGHPEEVAFIQWALVMAGLWLVPFLALGFRTISTNQY